MFDCGIHPGYSGPRSLPFLDEVDLTTVDIALITHFHLDHCAAVPFLIRKTKFKVGAGAHAGRVQTAAPGTRHQLVVVAVAASSGRRPLPG